MKALFNRQTIISLALFSLVAAILTGCESTAAEGTGKASTASKDAKAKGDK